MEVRITERGYRESCLGRVLQIKVFADGYPELSWRQVWETFAARYPNRWAVECFPPAAQLVDSKAVYHLFVCDQEPWGLDIHA